MNDERKKRILTVAFDGYNKSGDLIHDLLRLLKDPIAPYILYIKLSDALHFDVGSASIIQWVRDILKKNNAKEIGIFLDLKLNENVLAVQNILKKYEHVKIDAMSISEASMIDVFIELRKLLPNTKLVLSSVATEMSKTEYLLRYSMLPQERIQYDMENISGLYTKRIKLLKAAGESTDYDAMPTKPVEYIFASPTNMKNVETGMKSIIMNAANLLSKRQQAAIIKRLEKQL